MVAIPHEFFKRVVREACGVRLPAAGEYAVMMAFLPKEPEQYQLCKGHHCQVRADLSAQT